MGDDGDALGSWTMSARRRMALSPSRAGDYRQCPLLYRYRAIDRLREPKTIAQVKGTLVHAVLENMYGQPRPERTYPQSHQNAQTAVGTDG